jgi:hypothetical protein
VLNGHQISIPLKKSYKMYITPIVH